MRENNVSEVGTSNVSEQQPRSIVVMVVDPISPESNFEVTDWIKSDEGIEREYGTCLMAVEIEKNNAHPVDEQLPETRQEKM